MKFSASSVDAALRMASMKVLRWVREHDD